MRAIDRLACGSRLARVCVVEKVLFSVGLLLLALVLPPWPAAAAVLVAALIALWAVARVRLLDYLKIVAAPALFLVVSIVPLLLSVDFSTAGGVGLRLARGGPEIAGNVALRVLACLHCLLFLVLTTPIPQLLMFLRRCRIPSVVIEISLLVYRSVWVLLDTMEAIIRAQTTRLGYSGLRNSYRSAALLAASLLGNAVHRAQVLGHGLESRNWQGELRVLTDETRLVPLRLAGVLLLEMAILGVSVAWSKA